MGRNTSLIHRTVQIIVQIRSYLSIKVTTILLSSILLVLPYFLLSPALASPTSSASLASSATTLFETNCSGCHPNGNNIIRRGKTLKLRALKRQHVNSVDAIATLITQGKGLMSAYRDTLTADEIDAIATYVWEQAQINWKG